MAYSISNRCIWPTTVANIGSQSLPSEAFKHKEGLLRHYGYKVGIHGLNRSERLEILDSIFLRPLILMDDREYLSEWGEPKTARRLQKLAESIAAFTRNAKRRNETNFSKAIQDWEADLAYLKKTYYDNRFSFTAVFGLVSHRKAPGSNLASWQIVWLIQAATTVGGLAHSCSAAQHCVGADGTEFICESSRLSAAAQLHR